MKGYLVFALPLLRILMKILSLLCLSIDGGPIDGDLVPFSSSDSSSDVNFDESEITGYHFHTYFFQDDRESKHKAHEFRRQIQTQIEKGFLKGCRLNHFRTKPIGPHPVGSWETCCNSSAISRGLSWFMQNRGNHSVLLHPLTRHELKDHTSRAMFLGQSLFLNLRTLSDDLGEPDKCLPIPYVDGKN